MKKWTRVAIAATLGLVFVSESLLAEKEVPSADRELIVERDDQGRVISERNVALDENQNFVNHGPLRVYNQRGEVIGGGEYEFGKKIGVWRRAFETFDAPVIRQNAVRGFRPPFQSQVNFTDGRLDGTWVITDAEGKTVVQWEFVNGKREGEWTWHGPTGEVRKQVKYQNGQVASDVVAFRGKDDVRVLERYLDGRKLVKDSERYSNGRPKREGHVLLPLEVTRVRTNWWAGELFEEVVQVEGERVRHGQFKFWHPNGRPSVVGSYEVGKEVGAFAWYYDNGQKQAEGYYEDGVKEGQWQQWYANGQRSGVGVYRDGDREGLWRTWHDNGMRQQELAYNDGEQVGDPRKWSKDGQFTDEPAMVAEKEDAIEEDSAR